MSRRANPALVGGFVLGGLGIAVAGILFFGATNVLTQTQRSVIYFEGSVNGLQVGSPVKLEGVEVGQVERVRAIAVVGEELEIFTETVIEMDPSRFEQRGRPPGDARQRAKLLTDMGLRARLEMQSLITGQLYVALMILPDTPVRLLNRPDVPYPEIPSIPTTTQKLAQTARGVLKRIEELPLEDIIEKLDSVVAGVERFVNDPALASAVSNLNATLEQAQQTLEGVEAGSPLNYQVTLMLRELGEAARAIRVLADYLEENPNSVVFGRSPAEQ